LAARGSLSGSRCNASLLIYCGGVLEDLGVLAARVSALSAVVSRCTASSCLELVCELLVQVFSKEIESVCGKVSASKDICFQLERRD
jgi:hypothetical protein